MLRRILIGDNERVLVIRKCRFAEILEPGERWMFRSAGESNWTGATSVSSCMRAIGPTTSRTPGPR